LRHFYENRAELTKRHPNEGQCKHLGHISTSVRNRNSNYFIVITQKKKKRIMLVF